MAQPPSKLDILAQAANVIGVFDNAKYETERMVYGFSKPMRVTDLVLANFDRAQAFNDAIKNAGLENEVEIVVPAHDEISLDIDQYDVDMVRLEANAKVLAKRFCHEMVGATSWNSKSGKWHVVLRYEKKGGKPCELLMLEKVMMAVALGSDPVREYIAYNRAILGCRNTWLLFKPLIYTHPLLLLLQRERMERLEEAKKK
jgi:hypothetical protein